MIDQPTDARAIIDTAQEAAEPTPLDPSRLYHVALPDGAASVVLDLEKHLDKPSRKRGTVTVSDSASFIAYVTKHATEDTEVWQSVAAQQVLAVLNAPSADMAGWSDHLCQLVLTNPPAWKAWTGKDRQMLPQTTFAEHIEDNLADIVRPTGADMLELAQTFQATTRVQFESAQRLASGERQLTYHEETDAKAGKKGSVSIPETFDLALVPFEGSEPYKVTARLRYRINGGALSLGYVLDRPEDVLRFAFADIVAAIADGIEADVWAGRP